MFIKELKVVQIQKHNSTFDSDYTGDKTVQNIKMAVHRELIPSLAEGPEKIFQ